MGSGWELGLFMLENSLGRPESPFQYLKVQETCRRTLYKGME